MMKVEPTIQAVSLRSRLVLIILIPCILIAILVSYWRYQVAQQTSTIIFDRTLLAITMAISRDIVLSGGDALSTVTHGLLIN